MLTKTVIVLWKFNMGSEFFWGADTKYGCWEMQLADYVYRGYKVILVHGLKHSKFNHSCSPADTEKFFQIRTQLSELVWLRAHTNTLDRQTDRIVLHLLYVQFLREFSYGNMVTPRRILLKLYSFSCTTGT